MKFVPIVAIVLAVGAVAVVGYGWIETRPNYASSKKRLEQNPSSMIDARLVDSYRSTSNNQVYATLALAGLALIAGVIGIIKKVKVPISIAASGLAVVAAILAFLLPL